jgi:hypothetical protein
MIGRDLAAFGVYSVINCKKTVKASNIVIVNVIFSKTKILIKNDSRANAFLCIVKNYLPSQAVTKKQTALNHK